MKKMILNKINGDYRMVEASSVKSTRKTGIRYKNNIAMNRVVVTCDIGTILDKKTIDVLIYADIRAFIENGRVVYSKELDVVISEAVSKTIKVGC